MIKTGLHLLNGEIYESFPEIVKIQQDPEWLEFASLIQDLRDELVFKGSVSKGSDSIEGLDDLFNVVKVKPKYMSVLAEFFNTHLRSPDDTRKVRQKLHTSVRGNRRHATLERIGDIIEDILQFPPTFKVYVSSEVGWDENDSIFIQNYTVDYFGGIIWDEDNTVDSLFYWGILASGILVDVGNDGDYTSSQLEEVYNIIAEFKDATATVTVGYIDSITAEQVILKVIHSTFVADPPFQDSSPAYLITRPDSGF
jgi:hypothetical protein